MFLEIFNYLVFHLMTAMTLGCSGPLPASGNYVFHPLEEETSLSLLEDEPEVINKPDLDLGQLNLNANLSADSTLTAFFQVKVELMTP